MHAQFAVDVPGVRLNGAQTDRHHGNEIDGYKISEIKSPVKIDILDDKDCKNDYV